MHRNIRIWIVIFGLVVVGMFGFAYMKQQEIKNEAGSPAGDTNTLAATPYDYITRIDAKHFFEDGTHTLVGSIDMPTPCDLVEVTNVLIAESYPEQVTVEFSVINNADTCTQVITPQRFLVTFDAFEEASIDAHFMGRDVDLNLIPPAPGESPDDFELFIKG